MAPPLAELLERNGDRVRAVLNLLVETPYFYRDDDPDMFGFLRRHADEFAAFFEAFYGWQLLVDGKCARVYKNRWYNERVTEANRDVFNFSKRDECIAFMLLLEYFEHQLEEQSLTVEDENLRFRFGDLLAYVHRRFGELNPHGPQDYSEDAVRAKTLRPIMPELIKYRFLTELPRPPELRDADDTIYEAMPALYHYNTTRLSRPVLNSELLDLAQAPTAPGADNGLVAGAAPAANGGESQE